jgi:hypothetical protein
LLSAVGIGFIKVSFGARNRVEKVPRPFDRGKHHGTDY